MTSYLIKLLIFILFSIFIISEYYDISFHMEKSSGYIGYFIPILIIYSVYKYLTIAFSGKNIKFTPASIFGYFSLNLLILSFLFFYSSGASIGGGLALFFKILFFSFVPATIIFITTCFGNKILSYIKGFREENSVFKFLTSLGIGFFSFIYILTITGTFSLYNIYTVVTILGLFSIVSYKQIISYIDGFFNYKIELENHDFKSKNIFKKINFNLLSTELLFIIASFILSINLISIFRPFPIGWDDLGAYMNIPNLLTQSGTLIEMGGMFSWHTFTGIGYMLGNPTYAFFINNVGGILSFIAIVLIIGDLIKRYSDSDKLTFINLPLLAGTIFISMPMVIFQQAKDMKLDPGLFFVSIICFYVLFVKLSRDNKTKSLLNKIEEKIEKKVSSSDSIGSIIKNKSNYPLILLFIVGLLAGFAFSIKFTTLMLISAIFGVIFYSRLGILGFLGYLGVYFAIFTKGGLWSMMNVVFDNSDKDLVNNFSIITFLLGIILIGFSCYKNIKIFKKLLVEFGVLLLGIIIALLPYLGKNLYTYNLYTPDKNISIGTLLSGSSKHLEVDYKKIHTESELEEIKLKQVQSSMSSSGKTKNEDFGRYFGYEEGINNYVKLPWNLTMQSNQRGEFTDLTYIFLALLPLILLFLPFRNKLFSFGILVLLLLEILIFIKPSGLDVFTPLFSTFSLPGGYIVILGMFILPLLYFDFLLKDTSLNRLFKLTIIFGSFYTFLWTIAAFGIVWYGISMYFVAILMISLGGYYMSNYSDKDSFKKLSIKFFGSILLLFSISFYFFFSSIPHGFINLKTAGYKEYKSGKFNYIESVFLYHAEYLNLLYAMNIEDSKKSEFLDEIIYNKKIKNIIDTNGYDISHINQLLKQLENNTSDFLIAKDARDIRQSLYKNILIPNEKYKSSAIIYRLGTFLKYHISENNIRLFEDSLVTEFGKYIYDEDPDKSVDNMKKLGFGYILSDLNAATIDQDPRHDLTRRYEQLLKTFTSDKLELVETDSVCLKIALEEYKKDKDMDKYMIFAGVNYESYDEEGKQTNRNQKIKQCFVHIMGLIEHNKINKDNYPYLQNTVAYINNEQQKGNIKSAQDIFNIIAKFNTQGYKVLFRIK